MTARTSRGGPFEGLVLGREHRVALARAEQVIRDEESERQGRIEASQHRAATLAPQYYENLELLRVQADAEAHRAAVAEQSKREERWVAEQNYPAQLLAAGRRPRSVSEILSDYAAFA
jgi:hypothetical protein